MFIFAGICNIPVNEANRTIPWRHVDFFAPLDDVLAFKQETEVGDDLIAFGNDYIDSLIAAGADEAEARSQTYHFWAHVPVAFRLWCDHGGHLGLYETDSSTDVDDMLIRIDYLGYNTPAMQLPEDDPGTLEPIDQELTGKLQVTQAELFATPSVTENSCELNLSAAITTTGQTEIQYRLVNELGIKSQIFHVPVDQSWTAFVNHTIELDANSSGGGIGLTSPESPDDQIDDYAQEGTDNAQGYYQLEVIYPHHKLSNIADYNVDCGPDYLNDVPLSR